MTRRFDDLSGRRAFRAGMIGGGKGAYFAGFHRAAMRLTNRFEIVAGAFSSDPETCRQSGAALGLAPERSYRHYRDLITGEAAREEDGIEVAVVVTPNHLHFEPCELLLEAGIPVICDKPLVHTVEEACVLRDLAEQSNIFFAVSYTYTGYPMVRDARARVAAGEIGEVRFMYTEYLLEWLADDPSRLGKGGVWRGDPSKAGPTGALGDIGTHAFNILEFVSGQRCTALNAKLTRTVPEFGLDDTDVLQLEFDGGADGLLWCGLAAPGQRNGLKFKIVGTKGTLEWHQEEPETLHLSRLGAADVIYRRGQADNTADALACTTLPAGNPEAYLEALGVLYADYADALEAGANWRDAVVPIAGVTEGLRGVQLSEVAVASSKARAWRDFEKI